MPRNGDGSSDNGPIEGQDIVHGTSGSVRHHFPLLPATTQLTSQQETLQHVKDHIAPMPEIEKGEGTSPQSLAYRHFWCGMRDLQFRKECTLMCLLALPGMNASGGGDGLPKVSDEKKTESK
jgi:hypothetical protein